MDELSHQNMGYFMSYYQRLGGWVGPACALHVLQAIKTLHLHKKMETSWTSHECTMEHYFWQAFILTDSLKLEALKVTKMTAFKQSGGWSNKKMSSYQYRKFHCGDKTVARSSYLHNRISYTGKMASFCWISPLIVYIESGPRLCLGLYYYHWRHWSLDASNGDTTFTEMTFMFQ